MVRHKMNTYYDEDGITIYHADCRDVLPTLSNVDLVVTSPPYNLGDMAGGLANLSGGYRSYDDQRTDYDEWQTAILTDLWTATSPDGAIFYNHKPIVRDRQVSLPTRLIPPAATLRQIIIWNRGIGVNWSPSHFLPVHEWVLLIAHDTFRLASKTESHVSDVWTFPPDLTNSEHPAPFPMGLPLRAIAATTASTILDPFMGTGTTLRAAKDLGRHAIGIEIDERYCEMAVQRLAQGSLFSGSGRADAV